MLNINNIFIVVLECQTILIIILIMSTECRILKKGRGVNLIVEHFRFKKDRKCASKQYWRCVVHGCPARVHTTGEADATSVVLEKGEHNHIPDEEMLASLDIKKALCDSARSDKLTPLPTLYHNFVASQPFIPDEMFPSYESCSTQMWSARIMMINYMYKINKVK